ncbi:MAG: DegT/DnrJ/EryC1/StrS family aminotransferase [Acidobacteria bacterium]|nr:DegT/DnrJ/EryC1/StrS family aminotransferase [Acidobacteriota bacterium]MCB9397354.1 DegT/DnrJ/EryC1/StrS family aminotransferase [Acidobacteriota bacterium]
MRVPMLDLVKKHAPIREQLADCLLEVLDSGRYINGPYVERFENALADYCGVPCALGVSSGSDALILGLMALGVKPGDEIITTPFTFFATVGAIARVGAKPVFVDVSPEDFNMNPALIEEKITQNTVGIIPVSLFGQTPDLDPILATAARNGLWVMEDAAQSIGARYKEKMSGAFGTMGTFSFFPAKNLGGLGDGGAILTHDEVLADKMRTLRNHGGKTLYFYEFIGGNFRLDALQAAILSVKLPHLLDWEAVRRTNAAFYQAELKDIEDITVPVEMPNRHHVYNQFSLRITNGQRDAYKKRLESEGIGHAIYYPLCLHQQGCFSYLGHAEGDFPIAEQMAQEVLAIPVFTDQPEVVVEALKKGPLS